MPPRPRSRNLTPPTTPETPGEILADLPGFAPIPSPSLDESPLDPSSPSPSPSLDVDDLDSLDELGPLSEAASSSPVSTDRRRKKIDPATVEALTQVVVAALHAVGGVLHARLAADDRIGPNDVFIPDGDDQDAIGTPLASIMARRTPDGLTGSTDAADAIQAGIGGVGYLVKNLAKLRRRKAELAAGGFGPLESGGVVSPEADTAAGFATADGVAA